MSKTPGDISVTISIPVTIAISFAIANIFLAYVVSGDTLFGYIRDTPSQHVELFLVDHAGLPLKTVLEQLDMLGEEVVPVLRRELDAKRPPHVPDGPTHETLRAAKTDAETDAETDANTDANGEAETDAGAGARTADAVR